MMSRLLAALLAVTLASGCAHRADAAGFTDGRLDIVTAFYPLEFLSRRIGGPDVNVTNLTKPGAEPHDIELNPGQVGTVARAGLAVYLRGFQPAVDAAVDQEATDRAFDAATAVPLLPVTDSSDAGEQADDDHPETTHGMDPHVWLDPVRFATIADRLAERLAHVDPAHAADYAARGRQVHADLDALNAEFTAGLASCARHEIVTSHSAFHYLADRYKLTQVGITGISPEAEPSPQRLTQVAEQARATGTTTIFFETLVSPKVAETIARAVGARTAVLDPLEGLSAPRGGADYFSVMRANLAALTKALGCTS